MEVIFTAVIISTLTSVIVSVLVGGKVSRQLMETWEKDAADNMEFYQKVMKSLSNHDRL